MRRYAPAPRRRNVVVCALIVLLMWISVPSAQQSPQSQKPIVDPNVNMVRGITFPTGDPYLQRQNEPSIAVSTRNPCHLVAGANDYRSVDIPFDDTPLPQGSQPNISMAGDAWLGLFKSVDCGQKWESTLLPGYPQDTSGTFLELKGHEAGADPTVRAGSNGLFYYSGMVFNRGTGGQSKIFVARLIDNNNKERGDPIDTDGVVIIDVGTKGQFLDKPWLAVDVPRNSFGPGSTLATGTSSASGSCVVNGQTVPAGNVYMAYARFTGESDQHSKLMFARSTDCGKTFKTNPISNNQQLSQGANIAIAPHDGTVYLTWREFATVAGGPVNVWMVMSIDGGQTFGQPKLIAGNVRTFDQISTATKFRSNSLPAITADHQNRVYVAWSEVGFGRATDANGLPTNTNDARIVMSVSSDRGQTFGPRFAIDPSMARGHQMMPSLTFAAGKIQAIFYDSREDQSGIHRDFIDDVDIPPNAIRHTIDVRGVQADPGPQPLFVAGGAASLEISKYRQFSTAQTDPVTGDVIPGTEHSVEIGANPPNLAMYSAGTRPFIGDYIDVSGLSAFPIQTSNGQIWQPNIGDISLGGGTVNAVMASAFPTLPIFHAVWTDHRDVRVVGEQCQVPPDPSATGERNANIYTSRITPGLFVGSPGNTKPLGFRIDPISGKPTDKLIQRGFVVFAQNTTDALKFFEFHITSQPVGGRASFRQFEKDNQLPQDRVIVAIPKMSTEARTVYVTSTDVNAQVLINVQQVIPIPQVSAGLGTANANEKPKYDWPAAPGGLRASILLNPDRTNPKILDPDVEGDIPQIATTEIHNPSLFTAQFFVHRKGTSSRQLDVRNPDPESPDPESPDPENPDPESPDPESPDPESDAYKNPDPESPDPESPDPESPDPESPDPESVSVLNTAISEAEVANSTVTDINWRVHNNGNTTSAYRFRPVLQRTGLNTKYQLIVTRRYMMLTMDPKTCKPVYKSQNQVAVNIVNFDPKAPDPESPDPESPDPESPDPESPDPESPDPESPDPESASFYLAPDETATVTLRAFTPPEDEPPTSNDNDIAAKTAAQKANTGETKVSSAVTGPDLTLYDVPFVVPPTSRSGQTIDVTWTLTNRGTADAITASGGDIRTNVYFSTDAVLSTDDVKIGDTILEPAPFTYCSDNTPIAQCSTTTTTPVTMPAAAGQYYVIVVTDDDNDANDPPDPGEAGDPDHEVFEADELNNVLVIPVKVDAYQLAFVTQPPATTQDYTTAPAITVAVTHPDGLAVTAANVAAVTLSIANNAGGGILSGTLTAPNAGGAATFSSLRIDEAADGYTLAANAPFSTSALSAPFSIEVDAMPVTAADTYTVNEDTALTVPAATGVLANDFDPPAKGIKPASYVFDAVLQTSPAGGVVAVNADGSFSYTPNPHFNGIDTFTYRARDGRPGNATNGTVTITVTAVNDAPSFARGADQTVTEDAGLQTVPNWATGISAGPNESQALDFVVSNTNTALFSSQPAISPNGTLTFQSAPNAGGVATVSVQLHDDGGTANGGVDTSAAQTFLITVNGVNDAPVAVADAYTTNEDTPLNVNGPGLLSNDTDPENSPLTVEYLSTTTNGVLAANPGGSFTYTPNPHFYGTDSFTYRAFDGATTGNTVTVSIAVVPVNDAPSFTKGLNQTIAMNAPAQSVFGWATDLNAGPNESSQLIDFLVTASHPDLFNVQPAVAPNGTLTYEPKPNREGLATITVRAHDNGGTANGGADTSAPQTFTITITSAFQTYRVTNTNDSGNGSLRAAISNANLNPSPDIIEFDLNGTGVKTITPLTALPAITQPVTINAASQPGYAGTPLIELNGSSAGVNVNGFLVQSADVTIRGFAINRFQASGIALYNGNNRIAGNYIGTSAAGTAALPNGLDGVIVYAGPNVIGGTTATDRNVISGNARRGITVQNAAVAGTQIIGNYIGTNAAGIAAVGNGSAGVWVEQSNSIQIGGAIAGQGNVLSGNAGSGVMLYLCAVTCGGHTVSGNIIGMNAAATAAVGNQNNGITVESSNHTVSANRVAHNTGAGIYINAGTGNRLSQNLIHDNSQLGIDLAPANVTGNDAGDADAGPNNLQNFPVLTAANNNGGTTTVAGSLNSSGNTAFTIEFFSSPAADAGGYGEGRTFIGSLSVATDGAGNAPFTTTFPVAAGQFITATATDAAGNTSEFSQARVVFQNQPPTANNDSGSVAEDGTVDIQATGNDTDPNGDALSITNLVQPPNGTATAHPDGRITYAPAPNYFGADSFTYQVSDGRAALSGTATVNVTVTPVNDAPTFIKGANQSVNQNAGAQSVPNWATNISAGPFGESGQALTFIVSNDNNALFQVQPAVSAAGTLTFHPANGVAGTAIVSIQLLDDGGTAPGEDSSAVETFTITVVSTTAANYIVTNTNDSGNGSLRQAILNANATPFADTITFAIPGGGAGGEHVIQPASQLPAITGAVIIDATTQPGYDGKPAVRLHGNMSVALGLHTTTDVKNVQVKGFAVTRFKDAGLYFLQADSGAPGGHLIRDNFIGIDRNDTAGLGNGTGILLRNDQSVVTSNVVSGNVGAGILVENDADNVTISDNKIGTAADGNAARPNGTGIAAFGSLNILLIENNLISGNTGWGIDLQDLATLHINNARIRGNTIGLLANGTAQANGSGGVRVNNARNLFVGEPGQPRNVISGNNGPGIHLTGSPPQVPLVQNNYIGTDATGTVARGNALGVLVSGNSHALIGGAAAGTGNVISGNVTFGIEVSGGPTTAATVVQGNLIGLTADGANALGNTGAGIKVTNSAIQVGGTSAGARNVISANPQGVAFSNSGSTFNSFITGNYFGTDATGTIARGNSTGVLVGSAPGTRVGGELPGQGNLFAGNSIGLTIDTISQPIINSTYNAVVQGNTFGLSAGGGALPNGRGIAISNSFNLIGGVTAAQRNIIANSALTGVYVAPAGTQNSILGNSIYNSGGLGIDLGNNGLTVNDAGDTDSGANYQQNFPIIDTVVTSLNGTTVTGTINSTPNTAVTIELFSNDAIHPSGYGEGHEFLTSVQVATDANGDAPFSTMVPALPSSKSVTATATASSNPLDVVGSTSEFSQARAVNLAQTATSDQGYTLSDASATFYPGANDVDPDVASPAIRALYQPASPANLQSPGDVAIVSSAGIGYFTGGAVSAATDSKIGILNLAGTNPCVAPCVSGVIPQNGNNASSLTRVSQSTRIAYLRAGNFLQAIDGRSESPTFNQVILNMFFGPIQSMALNETTKRLYATANSTGVGLIPNGRVVVIDIDPASPAFHQILEQVTPPSQNATVTAIGVNPVTNQIYVGVSGTLSGVWVLDGQTHAWTQVGNGLTGAPQSIAVNDTDNLVYAVNGANLSAIQGADDGAIPPVAPARIAAITLPALANGGNLDSRLAIHRGTGRVFARLNEQPNPSRLVVVDGKPGSGAFNTIIGTLTLGRENGQTSIAIDEPANRLITTSTIDHESSVIDTTTLGVVGTVKSTQSAVRASIDLLTHRAYVSGGVGVVQVIDLGAATVVSNVQAGVELFGLVVDPTNHTALLAQTSTTTAVVRLNETGPVGSIPLPHVDGRETYLARNASTNKLYALNSGAIAAGGADALPGFVHVIENNAVTASVPVGASPFGLALDEVQNKIYVGNAANAFGQPAGITVINGVNNSTQPADLTAIPLTAGASGLSIGRDLVPNTTTGRVYFRILGGGAASLQIGVLNGLVGSALPIAGNVNTIRVNPVLNRVYVGATSTTSPTPLNEVFVLDGANDSLLTTLTVGFPSNFITNQSYLAVNTNTGRVYVADFLTHQLAVIDGATNNTVATIPVGRGPGAVAVNMAANRIYVGNAIERSLTIIDGATNRVIRTLALPLAPVQIAVDDTLSPARLYVQSTGAEATLAVVDDPGTAAPQITSITQPLNGTAVLNAADGTVTYTPNGTFSGVDSYTYTTSDGAGGVVTATAHINVVHALEISTVAPANGAVNVPYSHTFTATGGTGARSWFMQGTPPGGLTMTPAGVLSGTPAQSGTFTFSMQVRDSGNPPQIVSEPFTLIIGPPALAPFTLTNGTVNVAYSQQLFAGGAVGNVTWQLNTGGHPALAWLSLSNSGVLSGTHTIAGSTPSFTVTATDSLSQIASRTYTIFFNGPLDLTTMREGVVLENPPSLSFTGGNGTRTATLTGGALPPGLTLNANGSFAGQPLRHGIYTFTLELRDCVPQSSCAAGTTQQVVTRNVAWRISAREQQSGSGPVASLAFGGANGRKIAQVFTAGAHGSLTGVGTAITCPTTQTPVLVEIQRLTEQGRPDGTTIASGTWITGFGTMAVNPAIPMSIGERFAAIFSAELACNFNNPPTIDQYNGGDAYVNNGGSNWVTLLSTDNYYDLPSLRTVIQPAMDVSYMFSSHNTPTATVLANGPAQTNGKVLIAGHSSGTVAELFDPATRLMKVTGAMTVARQNATATLLGDGTVLLVGGRDQNSARLASAELFTPDPNNPLEGTFAVVPSTLATARENHRAVRFVVDVGGVPTEKVLITGGFANSGQLTSVEIYDVQSKTFASAGNMLTSRSLHTAVLLNNDKILIAGGSGCCTTPSAELYDVTNGTFTAAGLGNAAPAPPGMIVPGRSQTAAVELPNHTVLIAGGQSGSGNILDDAEIYDPATDSFTSAGAMTSKRFLHTATLLYDGSVLIAGGQDAQSLQSYTLPLATLERYIPGTGFVAAGSLEARRQSHAAAAWGDNAATNQVLIVGGSSQSWMSANTAELYIPAAALTIAPTTLASGTKDEQYAPVIFSATGGQAGYTFTFAGGTLPPGMTFDANAHTISGTPTANGVFTFSLRVSSGNTFNVQPFTLRIGAGNVITTSNRLDDAPRNVAYSKQLDATGASQITWTLLPPQGTGNPPFGSLPPGLSLSATGLLSGTPTTTGFYNFGVRAVDNDGIEAIKVMSLRIIEPLAITTTSLSPGWVGSTYGGCISWSGGFGTVKWALGGELPAGLQLQTNSSCWQAQFPQNAIRVGGTYTFSITYTDQAEPPQVKSREFTVSWLSEDQSIGWDFNATDVTLSAGTRRVAQVYRASSPHHLAGVTVYSNLVCPANTTFSMKAWPVIGFPARPDESGLPLGSKTITVDANGFFDSRLLFAQPVAMPQGSVFAIVLENFSNDCTVKRWAQQGDFYALGHAWIDDGPGWGLSSIAAQRYDLPFATLVIPDLGPRFFTSWRAGGTASVQMADGRTLVAGDDVTAEIYNPVAHTVTHTNGNMAHPRFRATATLLGNGKVLVAGGQWFNNNSSTTPPDSDVFDPSAGTFSAGPALPEGRFGHTATVLTNGRILIAGGWTIDGQGMQVTLNSTVLIDAANGNVIGAGPNMTGARTEHTATRLADGRVLIVGGWTGNPFPSTVAEIYDPTDGPNGSFTALPNAVMAQWPAQHTATLIPASGLHDLDGQVLIAGGTGNYPLLAQPTYLFDPATGEFDAGPALQLPRFYLSATLLGNDRILIAGGGIDWSRNIQTTVAEVYDPVSNTTAVAGNLMTDRYAHDTVVIPGPGNRVAMIGGWGGGQLASRSVEVFEVVPNALTINTTSLPDGTTGVNYAASVGAFGGNDDFYTFSIVWGRLPDGLSLNGDGSISGEPNEEGVFDFVVKVTNTSSQQTTQALRIVVDRFTITTDAVPDATVGVQYVGQQLAFANAFGAVTWSLDWGLPAGLTLSSAGFISGTPEGNAGAYNFQVRATDQAGQYAVKVLTIQVNP